MLLEEPPGTGKSFVEPLFHVVYKSVERLEGDKRTGIMR